MKSAQRMTESEYRVLLKHLEDAEYRINTKIYELDISCSLYLFEAFEREALNIEQRIQALKDLYPEYNIQDSKLLCLHKEPIRVKNESGL